MAKKTSAEDAASPASRQPNDEEMRSVSTSQAAGNRHEPKSDDLNAPPNTAPTQDSVRTDDNFQREGEASFVVPSQTSAAGEPASSTFRKRKLGVPAEPGPNLGELALQASRSGAVDSSIPPAVELHRLRELLFSQELSDLEDLKHRITNHEAHAQEVSEIVAEAILIRTTQDEKLNMVLAPTVEQILKSSLRHNPEEIADELFPIMGPAIRRSIAESFRSMLQSFHKSLEMSFSIKGLRWRLQALRTGRPFSEIVLLNTLVYRVEEIFLIHTKTGLVLEHLVNEGVQTQDADLISGMLTALQDFVADCFARGDSSELESMQMGDRKIFVIRLGQAYIACVVQGDPPLKLMEELRATLDLILVECAKDLTDFNGDAEPFKKVRRHLAPYLITSFADEGKEVPLPVKILPFALVAALLLAFAVTKLKQSYWHDAIGQLEMQPGIVITKVETSLFGKWKIFMLQDILAEDPKKVLIEHGFPEGRLEVESKPYLSLDRQMVRERVMQAILPPPGVDMTFDENQILYLKGHADMGWILATREKALAIAGVKDVNTKDLTDPRTDKLRELVNKVEGLEIHFPVDNATPLAEDQGKLEQAVDTLVEIEKLADEMGLAVNLIIYGHADATGKERHNYELSQGRAKTLAAMLYARGSSIPIATYGMGADHATRVEGRAVSDQKSRKIELRIRLAQSGTAMPDFLAN